MARWASGTQGFLSLIERHQNYQEDKGDKPWLLRTRPASIRHRYY